MTTTTRFRRARYSLDVHPSIARLAVLMQRKIDRDAHKRYWKDESRVALWQGIATEAIELLDASDDYQAAWDEAADVANFAMMYADRK